ncbi:MAG: hypothetical protein QXT73_01155 [Candidatus Methanomethylicaceae archaeon]
MYDPNEYPNLYALDERVRNFLKTRVRKDWDAPRIEWEICRIHPIYWMEHYGYIRPGAISLGVDGSKTEPIPFKLNKPQLQIADKVCAHFCRDEFTRIQLIVLKHRKVGASTLFAAFDYWLMRFWGPIHGFVIADVHSHTDNIMEMIRLFHERDVCGNGSKFEFCHVPRYVPMPRSKKGYRLSCGSMMEQDSGENKNPGTSATVNLLHMSENSKWSDPENAETSLLNSVPRKGFACIWKESTAFGMNKFASDCEEAWSGRSSWEFCFVSWLDMPDCCDEVLAGEAIELTSEEKELMAAYPKMTLGHIKFRRRQIDVLQSEEKFRQDFPLNPREPFLTTGSAFFNSRLVQDRIEEIKFFVEWKTNGLEVASKRFVDFVERLKNNPRGLTESLRALEDRCVIPKKIEVTENGGLVTFIPDSSLSLDQGAALMFRPPKRSGRYVLTIDAAEGKKSGEYVSDNSVIEVFDVDYREQVLEWCGVFDEEMTASYALLFAKLYNNALIVNEMNNTAGGAVWTLLSHSGYSKLFYRNVILGNKIKREPGWDTKRGIKREVLSQFRLDFKNGTCLIHSVPLLEEMLVFMDEGGKLSAPLGKRDDRVMATALALKIICVAPEFKAKKLQSQFMEDSYLSMTSTSLDIGRYV